MGAITMGAITMGAIPRCERALSFGVRFINESVIMFCESIPAPKTTPFYIVSY